MENQAAFPPSCRITTKGQFKTLFDQSLKMSQQHLLILYKPNGKSHARVGVIVGKRIAKSAVVRNKIKRVIRESFRMHPVKLKALDIVVIARQHCGMLDKLKLREGIDKLWQKLQAQRQDYSS